MTDRFVGYVVIRKSGLTNCVSRLQHVTTVRFKEA
jgi:hypothetical protein